MIPLHDLAIEPTREGVVLSTRLMGGYKGEAFLTWPMWEAMVDRVSARRPAALPPLEQIEAVLDAREKAPSDVCNDATHLTLGFCILCNPVAQKAQITT